MKEFTYKNEVGVDSQEICELLLEYYRNEKYNPVLYRKLENIFNYLHEESIYYGKEDKLYRNDLDDTFYIERIFIAGTYYNILIISDQNCTYIINEIHLTEKEYSDLEKIYELIRYSYKHEVFDYNNGYYVDDNFLFKNKIMKGDFLNNLNNSEVIDKGQEMLRIPEKIKKSQIYGIRRDENEEQNIKECINAIINDKSYLYSNDGEITTIFEDIDQIRTKNNFLMLINCYGNENGLID